MRNCYTLLLLVILVFMTQGLWAQSTTNVKNDQNLSGTIVVTPLKFDFVTPVNGNATDVLTIKNTGTSTLLWNIIEVDPVLVLKDGRRLPLDIKRANIKDIAATPKVYTQPANLDKNVKDSRTGPEVFRGIGGPDAFGYAFIDNNEPGGPEFIWNDISASGIFLPLGDDDFQVVTLPFAFPFYGELRNTIKVSSNGYLAFSDSAKTPINEPIPNTAKPNDIIAPFWDDLNPGFENGRVHFLFDVNTSEFIIQYTDIQRFGGGSLYTFQVILKSNGNIEYKYLSMSGVLDQATVGIENQTGDTGLQIAFNTSYVADSLAVLITPGCPWISEDHITSTIPPGGNENITLSINTTGLAPAIYECELHVNSDDILTPKIIVPVTLTVGPADIVASPLSVNFGDVLFGTQATQQVVVRNVGDIVLDVSSASISGTDPQDFLITSGGAPFSVAKGDSHLVDLAFSPQGFGTKNAVLQFVSNDPDTPQLDVSLAGNSITPEINVSPLTHDYGNVRINTSLSQNYVINNFGTANLDVSALTLLGNDATEFFISTTTSPFSIAPGDSQTVTVDFTPVTIGIKSATLRIESSDIDEPSIDVLLSGNGVAPNITVSPLSVDFGDVVIGLNATNLVTVTNTGDFELIVSATEITGVNGADFSITSGFAPFTLPPAQSQQVAITFNATSVGAKNGVLQINSDDPDQPVVTVALIANVLGIPDIAVQPTFTDFGEVALEDTVTGSFQVINEGSADLVVSDAALVGNVTDFEIQSGGGAFTLLPGDTHIVIVEFHPATLGAKASVLRFQSNDPDESPVDVALSGTGVSPGIVVIPTSFNFGDVRIDTSATTDIWVSNNGTAILSVSATTISGTDADTYAIISGNAPFTVAPNDTHAISIKFTPGTLGSKSAVLSVFSDDLNQGTFNVALSGVGVGDADITVSPLAVNFGSVRIDSAEQQIVSVSNDGIIPLIVSSLNITGLDSSDFQIADTNAFTLLPGEVQTVIVTFLPISVGSKTAALRFSSNDPDENPLDVSLSGVGIAPDINVSPVVFDYGNVVVGQSLSQVFTVTNPGSDTLQVSATSLVGAFSGEFQIVAGGGAFVLAPTAQRLIEVNFTPSSVGFKNAALRLASDDPDEPIKDTPLSGTGVIPDIGVSPDSIAFGSIEINTTTTQSLTISNEGTSVLTVTNVTLNGVNGSEFAVENITIPLAILPGDSSVGLVHFQPVTTGEKQASLQIESNDPDENPVIVPLTGMAIPVPVPDISVTPAVLSFGDVEINNSALQTLQIINLGSANLVIANTNITGVDSVDFAVLTSIDSLVVLPNDTSSVDVRFSPVTAGAKSATLQIISNDPDQGIVNVALSGTGITIADIAVSPTSVDFGNVEFGDSTDQTIFLINSGTADLNILSTSITDDTTGQFSVVSLSNSVVAPNDTQTVLLRYHATHAGTFNANLEITSNDPDESSVNVSLTAKTLVADISVSPASFDFGSVPIETPKSKTFIVINDASGMGDLKVASTELLGDAAGEFSILSGGAPFTLSPGDSQEMVVQFKPTSVANNSILLQIISNDPDEPMLDVAIQGSGILPIVHDFLFLTDFKVSFIKSLHSEGNVHSNDDISIREGIGGVYDGNITAVEEVTIRKNNTINGDVSAGDDIEVFGIVNGTVTPNTQIDSIPLPVISFIAGGDDIFINSGDTVALAPGSYGNVQVHSEGLLGGVLALSAGEYFFNELLMETNSTLITDVSGGLVFINIVSNMEFKKGVVSKIIPDGDAGSIKVVYNSLQTTDLRIGRGSRVLGSIIAPNSEVNLERETLFRGAVCAYRVKLEQFSVALHHFATAKLPADSVALAKEVAILEDLLPEKFELSQNYPNPFNPTTTIEFSVANEATHVSIKIYDITGRVVQTLVNEKMEPGIYQRSWDGRNQQNQQVASGLYIYRIIAGDFVKSRKMILLK